jgi:hypothetical protein
MLLTGVHFLQCYEDLVMCIIHLQVTSINLVYVVFSQCVLSVFCLLVTLYCPMYLLWLYMYVLGLICGVGTSHKAVLL